MADEPRQLTIDDLFIVLIPTRSNKMDINTSYTIFAIADALGKYCMVSTDDSPFVYAARTRLLTKAKERLDAVKIPYGAKVRALCMDDDISLYDPIEKLVEVIKTADRMNANVIANYHMVWTGGTLMNTIAIPGPRGDLRFTNNMSLARLKDFEQLPEGSAGGLGFYYGDVFLDYKYHTRNPDKPDENRGEDVNFFLDNKIPLHFVDLNLKHEKTMRI